MAELIITNLHKRLAQHYKSRQITQNVEEDLKSLKKLNLLFAKFEKNEDEQIFLVIANQIKTFNNYLAIKDMLELILEIIDTRYSQTILEIISNIDNIDWNRIKELTEDE